jgi:hypothetical protein
LLELVEGQFFSPNEEGRPAQAHGKQREGNNDVTLHLGQNGFFVCFHNEMLLCGKSRYYLEKNKKTGCLASD